MLVGIHRKAVTPFFSFFVRSESEADGHQDARPLSKLGVYLKGIRIALHVGQTHACTKAERTDIVGGC